MTKLDENLQVIADGIKDFVAIGNASPKRPDGNATRQQWNDYDISSKEQNEKLDNFVKERGPEMAAAAFNVLANFFQNIERIAEAQDPGNGR
jgi:hypothetical protein